MTIPRMAGRLDHIHMLLDQGRYDVAEQYLGQMLLAQPEDPEVYAMLALCRSQQGRHVDAFEAAGNAIRLRPDGSFCHYVMAVVVYQDEALRAQPIGVKAALPNALRKERLRRSVASLEEAIQLDPYIADYHCLMAQLEFEMGKRKDAEASARRALAMEPNDPAAASVLSEVLRSQGRIEEAEQISRVALSQMPEETNTHAALGWTLLHRGFARQAAGHFREALRIDPSNEWAHAGYLRSTASINPVYRWFDRLNLWQEGLSDGKRFLIGALVMVGAGGVVAIGKVWPSFPRLMMMLFTGGMIGIVTAYLLAPLFMRWFGKRNGSR